MTNPVPQSLNNLSLAKFVPFGGEMNIEGRLWINNDNKWCAGYIYKIKYSSSNHDIICLYNTTNGINNTASIASEIAIFNNGVFSLSSNPLKNILIYNGSQPEILSPEIGSLTNEELGYSIYFADFDGDGFDDLLTLNSTGFRVYVREILDNKEIAWISRSEEKKHWCYTHASNTRYQGLIVADFNGDNKYDLWCDLRNGTHQLLFNNFNAKALNKELWTEYSFLAPSGNTWCKTSSYYLLPGDFNGDGLDDILCTKEGVFLNENAPNFFVLFSLGNSTFVTKSSNLDGYIQLNYSNTNFNQDVHDAGAENRKLFFWRSDASYIINIGSARFINSGDFDGDGFDDLLNSRKEDNLNNQFPVDGIKILFAHPNTFFEPRSNIDPDGRIEIGGNQIWCNAQKTQNNKIVIGDFNGDKKDDVLCHNSTSIFIMFSNTTSSSAAIDTTKVINSAKITVSNYVFDTVNISESHYKTDKHQLLCNNSVNPGSSLKCETDFGSNLKHIEAISLNQSWLKINSFFPSQILTIFDDSSYYIDINTEETVSKKEIHVNTQKELVTQSTSSIFARSGECLKGNTLIKYAPDVDITFSAIALFTAYTDAFLVKENELLEFAKSIINEPEVNLYLNAADPTKIMFNVTGTLKANILGSISTYTEDCYTAEC